MIYKGIRGFFRVGAYMLPIILSLICVIGYIHQKNYTAAMWAGFYIVSLVLLFFNSHTIAIMQELIDTSIVYIRELQVALNEQIEKNKNPK